MEKRGVSQSDLGRTLGVSHTAVYKWLKNTIPSGETVSKIAIYFGVTSDDLLYGAGQKRKAEKPPPTKSEVEELFRQLPPATQHSVMKTVWGESLRECDVQLTDDDFKRGWVDAPLHYKLPDSSSQFPTQARIKRLNTTRATEALTEAISNHDANAILTPSLPESFLKAMPKNDPLRMLSPFSSFALVRVAVRLSFGDAAASKILKDLGFGFYLDLLSENNEPTF